MGTSSNPAQVDFWRGAFGDTYIERNAPTKENLKKSLHLWAGILAIPALVEPQSILEVGCNIGLNLRALRKLSDAEFFAVEPNQKALDILIRDRVLPVENLRNGFATAIDFPDRSVDLAFTSGVLIHIHPDDILKSCSEIYRVSRRYIFCCEYFSDNPEEVSYRDHLNVMFRRDYGSFWLDNFQDLQILDFGFIWKRVSGHDNMNWWLFEKRG